MVSYAEPRIMRKNLYVEKYSIVKKKRRSYLKIIGFFFIILGFLSLALLLYFDFVYKGNVASTITSSENASLLKENLSEEKEKETNEFVLEIETENVSIKSPIVEGVELEDLEKGVGHHKTTALPGLEGNVVLAGHNWYPGKNLYYKVFYDLGKLEIGDEIIIYYDQGKFIYKTIERKIVSPKDTEILEQTKEPILTLYTCYPRYTAKQRLVYVAELISWEKIQK